MDVSLKTARQIVTDHAISYLRNEVGITFHCIDNNGGKFNLEQFNSGKCYIGYSENKTVLIN